LAFILIEYLPIILICSTSSLPSDCKEDNKDVTVAFGEPKNTPMSCAIEGQTKAASLAFAPKLGESYYIKIKCEPKLTEMPK
jgi:hypothetical protein